MHTRRDLSHRSLEGIFRGENFEREDGRRMVVPGVVTPCSMRGLDERRGISLLAATGLTFFARSHATQYTLVDDKRQPPRPPRVATPVRQATRRCSRAIVTISSGEQRMRFSKFKSRAQGHRGYSSSSSSLIFSSLFLASDESNRERDRTFPPIFLFSRPKCFPSFLDPPARSNRDRERRNRLFGKSARNIVLSNERNFGSPFLAEERGLIFSKIGKDYEEISVLLS